VTDVWSFQQRASEGFVELVDVMPTLADFAGIAVPTTCPVSSSQTPVETEVAHRSDVLPHGLSICV
jgi:arylsulfatase A-like enzyme